MSWLLLILKKGIHRSYNFATYPNYSTMATCQLKTKTLYLSAVLQFTAVVTDLCTRRDERIRQNITMYSNLLAACATIFVAHLQSKLAKSCTFSLIIQLPKLN